MLLPTPLASLSVPPPERPWEPLAPGTRLGRHEVVRRLRMGSGGVVYLAREPRLGRHVALEVILGEGLSARSRARLVAEVETLAALDHPNIVRIHGVVEWGDDLHVAMEWVDGIDLHRWQAGTRPLDEILAAYRAAAAGLWAGHRAGVLHCDFNSSNVFVGTDGRVQVADFGVAVDRLERATRRVPTPRQLSSGVAHRSIAPELFAGGRPSERSDQFAFCVALREALVAHQEPRWLTRTLDRGQAGDPVKRWADMETLSANLEGAGRWFGRPAAGWSGGSERAKQKRTDPPPHRT